MKETGIIVQGWGVRAILDGRKTQTRRVIKIPEGIAAKYEYRGDDGGNEFLPNQSGHYWMSGYAMWRPKKCPYGKVGDRLYVKESHKLTKFNRSGEQWIKCEYRYEVDGDSATREFRWADIPKPQRNRLRKIHTWGKWRSSRFMYRFLARIWLEITGIRVERVQEITDTGGMREGWKCDPTNLDYLPRQWFKDLWDSIHSKGAWEKNEWVWVIEFKRVQETPE